MNKKKNTTSGDAMPVTAHVNTVAAPEPGAIVQEGAASSWLAFKAIALLLVTGLVAYANGFNTPFYMDDQWLTGRDDIHDFWKSLSVPTSRPLVGLTLHLNYRIHGLDYFGYHVVNVAIHLAAALTLFGLVRRTLLLPRWQGRFAGPAVWLAFATALLWLVHPLHTQAVTYIIQRCESLMGLCYLLTFYCLLRGSQSPHPWPWYLAAWLACYGGASSKQVMVSILVVLPAYDRIFLASWPEISRRRWLFYVAVAAIFVRPLLNAAPVAAGASGGGVNTMPAPVYWMTQAWVILYYLTLCFIPYPQVFRYVGWPHTDNIVDFAPAGLIVGTLLGLTAWLLRRRPWLGFLGLWFFGILSITSLVPLYDVAFDFRLYLPLAAICVLVVLGGHRSLDFVDQQSHRVVLGALLTCIVAGATLFLTVKRNDDYQSAEKLWGSAEKWYPTNTDILNAIATDLEEREKFEEACEYYQKSLRSDINFLAGFYYHGIRCKQDYGEDLFKIQAHYLDVVEYSALYHKQYAQQHYQVGKGYSFFGQRQKAEQLFRKTAEFEPENPWYNAALALALHELGLENASRESYRLALELDATWPSKAIKSAAYALYAHPLATAWMRKESLFLARQAAGGSHYKDLAITDMLVEAYAANGMIAEASAVAREATTSVGWQEQMSRIIVSYEKRGPTKSINN